MTAWTKTLALLGLTLCLAACDADDACDGGEEHTDGVGRYCAYGVIEGGFLCPVDLPFRYEAFGVPGAICGDRRVPPAELPPPACADAGFECGDAMLDEDEGTCEGEAPVRDCWTTFPGCCEVGPMRDVEQVCVGEAWVCPDGLFDHCDCPAPVDAGGPTLLPATECTCEETTEPTPASLPWPEESTCFDGCNWCACTSDGLVNCTARACDGG